jgi:NADH:ubiquinone oxidoreductase subunit 5 (subunit L)/multisubunit Na+/H+ antiporter MnhA subunit
MEEAPENGKESLHSVHANGMNKWLMFMSICFVTFIFLFLLGLFSCFLGIFFITNDLVYFVDWNIITLNVTSIIVTLLFHWISLLFIGFVFIISSLVILYSDNYMFGDLNIFLICYNGFDVCCFYNVSDC